MVGGFLNVKIFNSASHSADRDVESVGKGTVGRTVITSVRLSPFYRVADFAKRVNPLHKMFFYENGIDDNRKMVGIHLDTEMLFMFSNRCNYRSMVFVVAPLLLKQVNHMVSVFSYFRTNGVCYPKFSPKIYLKRIHYLIRDKYLHIKNKYFTFFGSVVAKENTYVTVFHVLHCYNLQFTVY